MPMTACAEDFAVNLSENARIVLEERYLLRDEDDNVIETPEQLFRRVAHTVAQAENEKVRQEAENDFYRIMASLKFLPNSPTIRNAGTDQCLSACFVIPFEDDSMPAILKAHNQCAYVMKSGGGYGLDFSPLRPKGANIRSTHKGACGPVATMRHINDLGETFTQAAGSFRKAAMMFILRIDHPDIREFIHCKDDGVSVTNANISVAITDEFIQALEEDQYFELMFNGHVHGAVKARDLWNEIAESAWKTGDPGLFFVDRVNGGYNPIEHVSKISATNPCGEVPLLPYESCNLGSVNLGKFAVMEDKSFDWIGFTHTVQLATRFLEDVVEVNNMPTPETAAANKMSRRVGLGVMGLADALATMEIPYDTPEAVEFARDMMGVLQFTADFESKRLAKERGTYQCYLGSKHEAAGELYRNAFRTVIAPTGSISIIADCSSGIEPYYSLEWTRTIHDGSPNGRDITQRAEGYQTWLDTAEPGSKPPDWLKTALEIDPESHIIMQAAVQEYTDSAVSKTINMPNWSTVEDVKRCYNLALNSGCKGITIYRQDSRDEQVLRVNSIGNECQSCQTELVHSGGCTSCPGCGWSACEI